MSGHFISFDGIDGCGKSTQIQLLIQLLESRGANVLAVRDPGGTKLGESIREILLHRTEIPLSSTAEMLLYMSSRAQLVQERILPALDAGQTVVSDRFLLANVVYQGCAGEIDPQTIWSVGKVATAGRLPDITFLMDIDPAIAFGRIQREHDRLESRGIEYMQRVRQGFLDQAQEMSDAVVVVDASQSIPAIHEIIKSTIEKRLS